MMETTEEKYIRDGRANVTGELFCRKIVVNKAYPLANGDYHVQATDNYIYKLRFNLLPYKDEIVVGNTYLVQVIKYSMYFLIVDFLSI